MKNGAHFILNLLFLSPIIGDGRKVNAMAYDLNQLSMFTGLTTRTLRTYLKQGVLQGEKIDGNWRFTEEQINAFFIHPAVRQSIVARKNALVSDFLGDMYKKTNRICTILDFPVSKEEGTGISEFFTREICRGEQEIEYRFLWEKELARVILAGPEKAVMEILNAYYRK